MKVKAVKAVKAPGEERAYNEVPEPPKDLPNDKYSHNNDKQDVNISQNEAVEQPETPLAFLPDAFRPFTPFTRTRNDQSATKAAYEKGHLGSLRSSKATAKAGNV